MAFPIQRNDRLLSLAIELQLALGRHAEVEGQLGQLLALMHELDHNALRALVEPLRKRSG